MYSTVEPSGAMVATSRKPRSSSGRNSRSSAWKATTATTSEAAAPPSTQARCRRAIPRSRLYVDASQRKARSKARNIGPWLVGTLTILAQSIGESESAVNADTTTDAASVRPNSLKSRPVAPWRKASGEKTATSAMVVAMMANAISRVPPRAAASGSSPSSSWCR